VLLLDAASLKAVGAPLYTSPALGQYPYSPFAGYSPPVVVEVSGLSVRTDKPLLLPLRYCRIVVLCIVDIHVAC
jgi:hypothetical protein